jgi:hypothetical protein
MPTMGDLPWDDEPSGVQNYTPPADRPAGGLHGPPRQVHRHELPDIPHDVDPRSLDQVEAEILRLSGEMNRATTDLIEFSRDWAEKKSAYDYQRAKAFLEVRSQLKGDKPTIPQIEAHVELVTTDAHYQVLNAEAVMKAAQEAGRNLRSQLDALRSINANARAASTLVRGEGG